MNRKLLAFLLIGSGIGLFLSAILVFGVSQGLFQPKAGDDSAQSAPLTGSAAPEFSLQTLDGKDVLSSQFRGKPVLINFWATWCGPCEEEMPLIQKAADQYGQNLIVLGINDDETADQVRTFVQQHRLSFHILMDPGSKVTDLYQVRGFPTTYFVNAQGKIQAIQIGEMSAEQLATYLGQIGVTN